jgi:hypothetical protein
MIALRQLPVLTDPLHNGGRQLHSAALAAILLNLRNR